MSGIDAVIQTTEYDEIYTPEYAVEEILPYIPKWAKTAWEPTAIENSNITKVLRRAGYSVIETHKNKGFDFIADKPEFDFDIIITNPPYSKKNEFLLKGYTLDKPFMFLLPIQTFETSGRGWLFDNFPTQQLMNAKRIDFTGKGSPHKNTPWFCYKIGLKKDVTYIYKKKDLPKWLKDSELYRKNNGQPELF